MTATTSLPSVVLPEWSNPSRRADALDRVAAVVFTHPPRRQTPTRAELRVLECMSHGMTTPMAADALGLSVETVKTHLRAARLRLAAKNTAHAVALVIRMGLIR